MTAFQLQLKLSSALYWLRESETAATENLAKAYARVAREKLDDIFAEMFGEATAAMQEPDIVGAP